MTWPALQLKRWQKMEQMLLRLRQTEPAYTQRCVGSEFPFVSLLYRTHHVSQLDEKEALKVSKLEAEAVVIDKALEELCSIGEAAREQFVASGGEVPAEGWDAAGEAAWRKTDAEAAAERQALELEIERLTKSSTSAPPVDRAGGAAVAGKA